ncbi:MAG TPA: T9SS type A sorting domain-containing protein [Bacteroidetes bacterium]|nr:T9SS type A sorting domain-containing protein [Bacteroidota bacterium]
MRKIYIPLIIAAASFLFGTGNLIAQCTTSAACGNTTASGSICGRSNFFFGEIVPNNGCASFTTTASYSPGEYFRMPVLQGGCYSVSTCGAPYDTQVGAYQGATTTNPFSYNDDNGPLCSGTKASITFTPTFTDYTRVDVRRYNCLVGGGGGSSMTVLVRQNNNLTITSASTDMCAGQTRSLTATPARITAAVQPNSGDVGTFSGSGVVGTTFTAPTPSGASGTVSITYDFGFCCTTQDITVFRAPSASNAGMAQTVCDSSATIAANPPTYGTGMWSIASGPGSINNPSLVSTTINGLVQGQTTVLVYTISNGPCMPSVDSVSITREMEPTPANAGPNQSICSSQSALAGNMPSIGNGVWTLLGGSGTIPSPSSPTSGVFGLGIGPNTFVWSISNGTCTMNSDTVVITRDAVPTTAFAGMDQSLCDSSTTLGGNAPGVGTGTWAIVSGTGSLVGPSNPNSALNGVAVGTTTLTWTINNGSCVPSVDTVNIVHNAAPAGPTVTGTISVCAGSSTILSASSGAATPSYTWWDAATGGNSIASTAVFATSGLASSTNFWVDVTDGVTTCTSARTMVTVTVNPLPSVTLGPDSTVCSSDIFCFDAGPGFSSYLWSNGGGTGQTACFSGSGNYWVIVTDSNNCQGSDTIQISTIPAPQVNLGADISFCMADSASIGITGAPGNTYLWSNGATTPMISVNQAGAYSLVCTDTNGCTGTDTIMVTTISGPVAAFSIDTSGCPQIVFSDQSTDASGWAWSFGDGGASSSQSPVHSYAAAGNGNYTVTLTATGLCGTDVNTQTVNIGCLVGLQLPSNLAISVYPNPNNGNFQIDFTGLSDDAHLRIFNGLGQVVYDQVISGQRGDFKESISLVRPAAGVYFVNLEIAGATISKRLVIK